MHWERWRRVQEIDWDPQRNLIVKSTAKFNFARLICLLIRGGSSSSLLIALFDGGVSPGATAPTLSTQIIAYFMFVVV